MFLRCPDGRVESPGGHDGEMSAVDGVRGPDDPALLRLPEHVAKLHGRNGAGREDVAQHGTGPNARQLVGVADKDNLRVGLDGVEERGAQGAGRAWTIRRRPRRPRRAASSCSSRRRPCKRAKTSGRRRRRRPRRRRTCCAPSSSPAACGWCWTARAGTYDDPRWQSPRASAPRGPWARTSAPCVPSRATAEPRCAWQRFYRCPVRR